MSEKRKWFDSKERCVQANLPMPSPILNTSVTTCEEETRLGLALVELEDRTPRNADFAKSWLRIHEALNLFVHLGKMSPRVRLARNLKVLLDQMVRMPIESIIRDGLDMKERHALVVLEQYEFPSELKVTAQALLNVYERYQVALSLRHAFA